MRAPTDDMALLRASFDLATDPLILATADGQVTAVNAAAERILGAQRAARASVSDVLPALADGWQHVVRSARDAAGQPVVVPLRYRRLGESGRRSRRVGAMLVVVSHGESLLLRLQDAGRWATSHPVLVRGRSMHSALRNLPVLAHLMTNAGEIIDVNPTWLDTLGHESADVVVGRPWDHTLAEPSLALADRCLDMLEDDEDEVVNQIELQYRTRAGNVIDVLVSLARLDLDEDGRDYWVLAVGSDITARLEGEQALREARDQARSANRAKTAFLANMSHELRTPLNGVLGYAQILEQRTDLDDEIMRSITTIRRSGEHLLMLINDVLDLARIEANRLDLIHEPFHLLEFLHGVSDVTRVRAEQKGLSFVSDLAPDLPTVVVGDVRKLRQVLLNLLGNAVKFTRHGGVTLRVHVDDDDCVAFAAIDTGVGIAEEDVERAFRPFGQVGVGKLQTRTSGTGLGLTISRELVSLMGGALEVETAKDEGSDFHFAIALPVADARERTSVKQRYRRRVGFEGDPRRVLVVDDRPENRAVVAQMLEPLGFELDTARNGSEALEKCRATPPDVVLMDVVMPVLDGFEATRRLRRDADTADIQVIIFSASVFDDDREASLEAGADAFLPKPVQLELLLDTLGNTLDLEWIEAELGSDRRSESSEGDKAALEPPPIEELLPLLDAARDGRIVDVRSEVRKLQARIDADPGRAAQAAFVQRLAELIAGFDLDGVSQSISSLI